MSATPPLYHRTCSHRIERILSDGFLQPQVQPVLRIKASWFSHAPWADRRALGLTSHTLTCDRMEFLLRVIEPINVTPWLMLRATLDVDGVRQLERVRGTRPDLWWLTGVAQRVELVEDSWAVPV